MRHLILNEPNLQECAVAAAEVLSQGGLVVYPTETVYGVAVDATNASAVSRLLTYKNRPVGRAISVCVADEAAASQLVELNETATRLYRTFLPGPLTVISKSRGMVDARLASELGTLGIRISAHPFVAALTAVSSQPFTATSANRSGGAQPYSITTLLASLSPAQQNLIDLVIDAGTLPRRDPSTVIDTTSEAQDLVRAGSNLIHFTEQFQSASEEETRAVAARLLQSTAYQLRERALLFALEGEMGAGKTQFAKGIAAALGVEQPVTSPTYTLMEEYAGSWEGQPVYFLHLDLWRLTQVTLAELDLERSLLPNTVIVVEWVQPLLPHLAELTERVAGYRIFISHTGETSRSLSLAPL